MWTEHLYVDPPNLLWHQRRPERSNYIIPILINVCPLEYLEHKSRTSEHSTLGPSLTSVSEMYLYLPRTRLRDHYNQTDGTEMDLIMYKDVRFITAQ